MTSKLTKEQKLEMVSKAIDAGFTVELSFYGIKSDSQLNKKLAVFDKNLERKLWCSSRKGDETTGLWINSNDRYENKFNATIFIDSLSGDSK